jgi:hypothetical protein
MRSLRARKVFDREDKTGVHARVQTRGGGPSGEQWPTANADRGGARDSTLHAALSRYRARAADGPRWCTALCTGCVRLLPVLSPSPPLGRPSGFAGDKTALGVEGVVGDRMGRQKSLGRSMRFEPVHLPFSTACWLVRVLGPVVPTLPLVVAGQKTELACGGAI